MKIEFNHGATVHRLWESLPDGDFLAAFSWPDRALKWAQMEVERENDGCRLVVIDHSRGKVWQFTKSDADQISPIERG